MKFDSYTRFLKSLLYQECMLAEVEGRPLPDPYHIPSSPTSKHSTTGSDRSNLSTPKKVMHISNGSPGVSLSRIAASVTRNTTRTSSVLYIVEVIRPLLLFNFFVCPFQEDKKSKSGRSLNEDSRDDSGDRKKGMFFSWSRNRSFGKGPKKRELADFNYSQYFYLPSLKASTWKSEQRWNCSWFDNNRLK